MTLAKSSEDNGSRCQSAAPLSAPLSSSLRCPIKRVFFQQSGFLCRAPFQIGVARARHVRARDFGVALRRIEARRQFVGQRFVLNVATFARRLHCGIVKTNRFPAIFQTCHFSLHQQIFVLEILGVGRPFLQLLQAAPQSSRDLKRQSGTRLSSTRLGVQRRQRQQVKEPFFRSVRRCKQRCEVAFRRLRHCESLLVIAVQIKKLLLDDTIPDLRRRFILQSLQQSLFIMVVVAQQTRAVRRALRAAAHLPRENHHRQLVRVFRPF